MTRTTFFSDDYSTARRQFRSACQKLDVASDPYPLSLRGPSSEELTTDVARVGPADAERVVVLSSALHGVEGFFGSAAQLAVLDAMASRKFVLPDGVAVVLIHALNPWGFAWLRRTDAANIDANRNFLLADEAYEGCSDGYRRLSMLLNPTHPPRRIDFFTARAAWQVLRHGMPTIKQAVAGGQHEFAKGLFYAGSQPNAAHQMLAKHLATWIGPAKKVLHLDFHTGLGPSATYRLLVDYVPTDAERQWLAQTFGSERLGDTDARDVAYEARGALGRWCRAHLRDIDYIELCAEFGTYSPLKVLAALRAENQAHHWSRAPITREHWTKRELVEVFCPANEAWRERCVEQAVELVGRAVGV